MKLALLVALLAVAPGPLRADPAGRIAVLPMTAGDKRLELYGQVVAATLAKGLAKLVAQPVQVVSLAETVPTDITWVIDGRIIAEGGKITLEARLRDPRRGSAVGTVATRAATLARIDALTVELTTQVATLCRTAEAARLAHPAAEPVAIEVAPIRHPVAPRPSAAGPAIVVLRASARVASGAVLADAAVSRDAAALVARLGARAVTSDVSGATSTDAIAAAIRTAHADRALWVEVRNVDFDWHGVLSAIGEVRVVLYGRAGTAILDELETTDTLVGSRGDRQSALVHFVAEQALDIAQPRLRRLLGAR